MNTLAIEPVYRVILGDVTQFRILLVGCGGTGSTLTLFLAGLAFHAQQKGIDVDLTLVDPDVVEMKNCGRQAVSVQAALAGNIPKVADLSLRLNAAYGLAMTAWPVRYEVALARDWYDYQTSAATCAHLIIGCVDNHLGRQQMAETVAGFNGRIWAIDCGNEQHNGQVLIGNLAELKPIRIDKLGLCSGLPSPYVQESALLTPDPEPDALSCAEMALAETQSLMVNRLTATIAAQYVTTFVLQRQICYMATYFGLEPPTATSRLITITNLKAHHPVSLSP